MWWWVWTWMEKVGMNKVFWNNYRKLFMWVLCRVFVISTGMRDNRASTYYPYEVLITKKKSQLFPGSLDKGVCKVEKWSCSKVRRILLFKLWLLDLGRWLSPSPLKPEDLSAISQSPCKNLRWMAHACHHRPKKSVSLAESINSRFRERSYLKKIEEDNRHQPLASIHVFAKMFICVPPCTCMHTHTNMYICIHKSWTLQHKSNS